jgi:hypothetical protein
LNLTPSFAENEIADWRRRLRYYQPEDKARAEISEIIERLEKATAESVKTRLAQVSPPMPIPESEGVRQSPLASSEAVRAADVEKGIDEENRQERVRTEDEQWDERRRREGEEKSQKEEATRIAQLKVLKEREDQIRAEVEKLAAKAKEQASQKENSFHIVESEEEQSLLRESIGVEQRKKGEGVQEKTPGPDIEGLRRAVDELEKSLKDQPRLKRKAPPAPSIGSKRGRQEESPQPSTSREALAREKAAFQSAGVKVELEVEQNRESEENSRIPERESLSHPPPDRTIGFIDKILHHRSDAVTKQPYSTKEEKRRELREIPHGWKVGVLITDEFSLNMLLTEKERIVFGRTDGPTGESLVGISTWAIDISHALGHDAGNQIIWFQYSVRGLAISNERDRRRRLTSSKFMQQLYRNLDLDEKKNPIAYAGLIIGENDFRNLADESSNVDLQGSTGDFLTSLENDMTDWAVRNKVKAVYLGTGPSIEMAQLDFLQENSKSLDRLFLGQLLFNLNELSERRRGAEERRRARPSEGYDPSIWLFHDPIPFLHRNCFSIRRRSTSTGRIPLHTNGYEVVAREIRNRLMKFITEVDLERQLGVKVYGCIGQLPLWLSQEGRSEPGKGPGDASHQHRHRKNPHWLNCQASSANAVGVRTDLSQLRSEVLKAKEKENRISRSK